MVQWSAYFMSGPAGFEQFVGPITYEQSGDDTKLSFTIADQHLNGDGFLHGGMMMTLASAALGQLARLSAGDAVTAPLSVNCDFVGPGKPGATVAGTAEITRRTRSVIFASAELRADDQLMMTATGVYRIGQEA
jgi:uncharacterized protein (TIGR00369 family)